MHLVDLEITIEAHWAIRRPQWTIQLDDQVLPENISVQRTGPTTEIISSKTRLEFADFDQHYLRLIMSDKTNDDLLLDDHGTIVTDHYIIVKEISLDGFEIGPARLTQTSFAHSMPRDWVKDMESRGISVPDTYKPGTEIRLNGIMTLPLSFPVWQWWCEKMQTFRPGDLVS